MQLIHVLSMAIPELHLIQAASNISESEEKKRKMKDQDSNRASTRFEQSSGGHVPVGDDEDVDDEACLPPRSVFPISLIRKW